MQDCLHSMLNDVKQSQKLSRPSCDPSDVIAPFVWTLPIHHPNLFVLLLILHIVTPTYVPCGSNSVVVGDSPVGLIFYLLLFVAFYHGF